MAQQADQTDVGHSSSAGGLWIGKGRPKAASSRSKPFRKTKSVVIDDDLAAIVVDIAVMIAPFNDDRIAIAVIVAVTNHFAFANHVAVAVTMALTDRHATRTDADADFFGKSGERGSDDGRRRNNCQT
jgi:hypothetical protein